MERTTQNKGKQLPYNTGKVSIGKDYVPPKREPNVSEDMYNLQSKLLGSPMPTTLETWAFRVVVVVAVAIVMADLFVWRP